MAYRKTVNEFIAPDLLIIRQNGVWTTPILPAAKNLTAQKVLADRSSQAEINIQSGSGSEIGTINMGTNDYSIGNNLNPSSLTITISNLDEDNYEVIYIYLRD